MLNKFSLSTIGLTAMCFNMQGINPTGTIGVNSNTFLIRFTDAAGVVRLRLISSPNNASSSASQFILQKVNAAGTATTLATSFTGFTKNYLAKLSFMIDYQVSGSFVWYIDGVPVLSCTGDLTTDSVTALAGFDLGQPCCNQNTEIVGGHGDWSEAIVADTDPRSLALYTVPPSGAGATSDWDGASDGSTVNEITMNQSSGISTAVADEVALFSQAGTLVSPFIVDVAVSASAMTSPGNPQNLAMALRRSGTTYFGGDQPVDTAFGNIQTGWAIDPSTAAPWTSLSGLQIGVKSRP
ncbi:MAG: hypothetical protein WDN25_04030 [Acetobacteraceae bacterium]